MLRNLGQRVHRIPNKTMKAFQNMGVGNHVLTAMIRKDRKQDKEAESVANRA